MKLFKKSRITISLNDQKTCRICLDDDDPANLISPCLCSGGSEYVHRNCLDSWRSMNKGGRAFEYCDVCHLKFIIEPLVDDPFADRKRLWLFRFLVTRDITLIMILLQGIIFGMTFLLRYLDRNAHAITDLFPRSMAELGVYYLSALIIFLALLGLFGLIAACCGMLADGELDGTSNCRCYGCFWFGYGSGHNCNGGSNCDGGGDSGGALGIVILIFAAIGLIVGIILTVIIVRKIAKRHTNKLWLRQEAKKYVVKDFQGRRNELPAKNTSRQTPQRLSVASLSINNNTSSKISFVPIHASKSNLSTV